MFFLINYLFFILTYISIVDCLRVYDATAAHYDGGNLVNDGRLGPNDATRCFGFRYVFKKLSILDSNLVYIDYRFIYNATTAYYNGGNCVNESQLGPNDAPHRLGPGIFFTFISLFPQHVYVQYIYYNNTMVCHDGGSWVNYSQLGWIVVFVMNILVYPRNKYLLFKLDMIRELASDKFSPLT
jgi:hypothetical protein